jgi:putative DNA primase/helicase
MNITGESFKQSAAKVRDVIAFVPENRICSHRPDIEQQIRRILIMTKRLRPDDDAHRYLTSRGITRMPMIGLHPGMPYWDGQKSLGVFPVMIASSRNTEGTIVALHRTYLQDGRKAPVPNPKKSIGPILGTALRLYPAADIMGVAEGIETACAASKLFHMPTWAALNAGEMERFTPDPIVKELHIFADNDASFTGQMAANKLAHRLSLSGLHCFVHVPDAVGTDWADEVAK